MKSKLMLIVLLISSFFIVDNVHAVIVYPETQYIKGVKQAYSTGITWYEHGYAATGMHKEYTDTVKVIPYNGADYITYCVDPGLTFSSGKAYNCEESTDPGLIYLMSLQGSTDYSTLQLAMRLYASEIGVSSDNLSQMKAAVIRYRQIRTGGAATGEAIVNACAGDGIVCSPNYTDYLVPSGTNASNMLETAWGYYQQALAYYNSGSFNGVQATNFTITKRSENKVRGNTVIVYDLQSTVEIANDKINFVCSTCTDVNWTWNKTIGTLTITIGYDDCSVHNVDAYYPASGVQVCEIATHDTAYQRLITNFSTPTESETDTTNPSATIEVSPYECGGDCCEGLPSIRGNVNNCCYESGDRETYVYEPNLNELFCRDTELNIDYFKNKCGNEVYKMDKLSTNPYCDLYCTERVRIYTPYAVTAKSGRYFVLRPNGVGPTKTYSDGTYDFNTTSPYLNGAKRCRMKIYYDQWEANYLEQIQKQVNAYNLFQNKYAHYLMYTEGTTETDQELTETISCSCSCTAEYTCPTTTTTTTTGSTTTTTTTTGTTTTTTATCTETARASKNLTCTVSYDKYTFPPTNKTYYQVKRTLSPTGRVKGFDSVEVEPADSHGETRLSGWRAYNIDYSACEDLAGDNETSTTANGTHSNSCTCTYDCTVDRVNITNSPTDHRENVPRVAQNYLDASATAKGEFNSAVGEAKLAENRLKECNDYFTEGEGKNGSDFYTMEPHVEFKYEQKYIDEYGNTKTDETEIVFDQNYPGCKVSSPILGVDGEDVFSPQYSSDYAGEGINNVTDFSSAYDLAFSTSETNYTLDTTYPASRRFTYDAKFEIDCAWKEKDNQLKTLVPSGEVVPSETVSDNFTLHETEYKVYITTFTGRYETRWGLTGIGEKKSDGKGKFDDYIKANGVTCDSAPADTDKMFTCGLEVTNTLITWGPCTPEPCKNKIDSILNFKVVDPNNLFPTGTVTEGKSYAYNWTSPNTPGPDVMEAINKKAERDETYAPTSATYSFTLNPSAMRHIKNYNVEKNETNGYNDFNFHCNCPKTLVQTNTLANGGVGCTECKSYFLENLEDGKVVYDHTNHTVDVWSSSKTIKSIRRDRLGWEEVE